MHAKFPKGDIPVQQNFIILTVRQERCQQNLSQRVHHSSVGFEMIAHLAFPVTEGLSQRCDVRWHVLLRCLRELFYKRLWREMRQENRSTGEIITLGWIVEYQNQEQFQDRLCIYTYRVHPGAQPLGVTFDNDNGDRISQSRPNVCFNFISLCPFM